MQFFRLSDLDPSISLTDLRRTLQLSFPYLQQLKNFTLDANAHTLSFCRTQYASTLASFYDRCIQLTDPINLSVSVCFHN